MAPEQSLKPLKLYAFSGPSAVLLVEIITHTGLKTISVLYLSDMTSAFRVFAMFVIVDLQTVFHT
jgi:hypothetical protein